MTDSRCPFCGSLNSMMELHGSLTCMTCKNKVASCCGDSTCDI